MNKLERRARDYIIDTTARMESGGRYDAWNPNDSGKGVSFGLIQFNQKVGDLSELLIRMYEKDAEAFSRILEPIPDQFLQPEWVRSAELGTEHWKKRFQELGRRKAFQVAQREIADERYLEPAILACEQNGLSSQRAVAMAFDCAVQRGRGRMQVLLLRAARLSAGKDGGGLLHLFAAMADDIPAAAGRRTRLLNSRNLSDLRWDRALLDRRSTVQRGSRGLDVRDLQLKLRRAMLYTSRADGLFGPATEAALREYQETRGLIVDRICGPKTWAMIIEEYGD